MYKQWIVVGLIILVLFSPTFFKKDNIIKHPTILKLIEPDTSKIVKPTKPTITYIDITKHIDIRKDKEEELKREPIVLTTTIKGKELVVTSIDSIGVLKQDIYNIPIQSEISIKNDKVKIRKKILPRLLVGVGVAITASISYIIIKNKIN